MVVYKNEAEHTAAWLKSFREENPGSWLYKIGDIGNTLKPIDIVGFIGKVPIAIEFKFFNLKKNPTPDKISPKLQRQQMICLDEYHSAGNEAWVITYNKSTRATQYFRYVGDGEFIESVFKFSNIQHGYK